MIKAIIIEDELYIRKGLRILIKQLNIGVEVIGESVSVRDALEKVNLLQPDLIFLDIKLLDGTAFSFLDKIKGHNFKIIFITSYKNYAIKAIKTGAIDYLLKPIDIDELKSAINRAKNKINKKTTIKDTEFIILNSIEGKQIIPLNELIYCKSHKGYTTFYMKNGKTFLSSKPLKEYENHLTKNNFIRTHQSYFANVLLIEKFDSKQKLLYLKENNTIPVAARKVSDINKKLKI